MALQIFPPEIWEKILERLEDSRDILAIFQTYPELEAEGVLQNQKRLWLFDRVTYFIIPWLGKKDIIKLRQVCKKWCWGLDNCLENHPSQLSYYNPDQIPITGQYWFPEASPLNYSLADLNLHQSTWVQKFASQSILQKFHQDMENISPERNPFIGRRIEILGESNSSFNAAIFQNLQQYGKHVWFLTFNLRCPKLFLENYAKFLGEVLKLTPNLKTLTLNDNPRCQRWEIHDNNVNLPCLPLLEVLEIGNGHKPALIKLLSKSYGKQVRKLIIGFNNFIMEFAKEFPSLKEVNLKSAEIVNSDKLQNLLCALEPSNICKINIYIRRTNVDVNSIFEIFPRFPKLQFLVIAIMDSFGSRKFQTSELALVPSVKFLDIRLNWNSSSINDTFDCFPSLEYVKIRYDKRDGLEFNKGSLVKRLAETKSKLKGVTFVPVSLSCREIHFVVK